MKLFVILTDTYVIYIVDEIFFYNDDCWLSIIIYNRVINSLTLKAFVDLMILILGLNYFSALAS